MCWQISGKESRTWTVRHQHFHVNRISLWPNISSAVPSEHCSHLRSSLQLASSRCVQRERSESWTGSCSFYTGAPSGGSDGVTAKRQVQLWLMWTFDALNEVYLQRHSKGFLKTIARTTSCLSAVKVCLNWVLLFIFVQSGLIRRFHLWLDERYRQSVRGKMKFTFIIWKRHGLPPSCALLFPHVLNNCFPHCSAVW